MSFKLKAAAAAAVLAVLLSACGKTSPDQEGGLTELPSGDTASQSTSYATAELNTDDMFSDRDTDAGYDISSATAVSLSDKTVTVNKEGTYILSGSISDGQIIVEADKTAKIQLVLNGVDITSSSSAPIYVKQADKVFITLADGSVNRLSNRSAFSADGDTNVDAVIFSKEDLTLNGGGSLEIDSAGHGIVSKDDLVIASGDYSVSAASHAVSGKDSVRICGGSFVLTAGKDGIHAENSEDSSLGFLYVSAGDFNVKADGDGLSASAQLRLDGGTYAVTCGGGAENAAAQSSDDFFGFGRQTADQSSDESDVSCKGIKSSGSMWINGGTLTLDCADDGVHSNSDITVSGGEFSINSGDDGFHADAALAVSGGYILINESYEGLEGLSVEVAGGDIRLTADDDGINAAGGNDESGFTGRGGMMKPDSFAASSDSFVKISGGRLIIDAAGDGIDSNGALYVSGGETYVAGPTNSGNGALDFGSTAEISGGIFVATGSSGMSSNFSESSEQGAIMVNRNGGSGVTVTLKSSDGKTLISYTPDKDYSSVVLSHPEIRKGESYTVTVGSSTVNIDMTGTVYSENGMSGMGGGMSGGMGGMGNRPGMR